MKRTVFVLSALAGIGAVAAGGRFVREQVWVHNRAVFHQERAPKVLAHFNKMFGLELGSKTSEDSFVTAQSRWAVYMVEHPLKSKNAPCGTVQALGTSDNPNIVSLRYVLDRKAIKDSNALEALSRLQTSLIYRFGEYKVRFDPELNDSQCVIFIYPSEDAVEHLMESGKLPALPDFNELQFDRSPNRVNNSEIMLPQYQKF